MQAHNNDCVLASRKQWEIQWWMGLPGLWSLQVSSTPSPRLFFKFFLAAPAYPIRILSLVASCFILLHPNSISWAWRFRVLPCLHSCFGIMSHVQYVHVHVLRPPLIHLSQFWLHACLAPGSVYTEQRQTRHATDPRGLTWENTTGMWM